MTKSEARICQNCKKDFALEAEDFAFYEKMQVPPPTFCADCRLQRRLSFRNDRHLYKRKCDVPGHDEEMISMYAPESSMVVYDRKYWWTDQWDPMVFGKSYDFSKPFFQQFRELMERVPWFSLFIMNSINSDYGNYTTDNKDCYLVFGGDYNEHCFYSTFNFHSKDCLDVYWVEKCELCYEVTDSKNCYRVLFSRLVRDCADSALLFDCSGCNNCFGCVGLRNKQYCWFNEQLSKEEYEKNRKEVNLGDSEVIKRMEKKAHELKLRFPHRYAQVVKSVNSSGDNIVEAKNCKNCFEITGPAENLKDVFLAVNLKDVQSCDHIGHQSELAWDSFAIFADCQRMRYSMIMSSSYDVSYSYNCRGCNNCFGCACLQNKSYCILNKQYAKEEYEALVPKIVEHMNTVPYVDRKGRIHTYGEFFPTEISPFAYNETVSGEMFPLTKEQVMGNGWSWREMQRKDNKPTMASEKISSDISNVSDAILNEVIECSHKGQCNENCASAFRIVTDELSFYRQLNLPLPTLCSNCRHYQRMKQRNPIKLWHRKCQCSGEKNESGIYQNTGKHQHGQDHCPNEFETTYSPDRPEIVYCENCYQSEVI